MTAAAAALGLLLGNPSASARTAEYLIQARDTLSITVWRHPDLDTTVEVDAEGDIVLPMLGKVRAAGLTIRQLEKKLTGKWGRSYIKDPYVRISLPQKQFFVFGEVREPGSFELLGNMTVMRAIAAAGGFTDFAARRKVRIIRSGVTGFEMIEVNIPRIQAGRAEDTEIQPGDVISVPQSFF